MNAAASKGGDAKELANIKLTDEQRSAIERTTGVKVSELTVLEFAGESARRLTPGVLKASSVVMCW
jgi:hypothetical protein